MNNNPNYINQINQNIGTVNLNVNNLIYAVQSGTSDRPPEQTAACGHRKTGTVSGQGEKRN